ncbi:hypothetical protein BGZ80_002336, partial [Entomortierella chlamydospora]
MADDAIERRLLKRRDLDLTEINVTQLRRNGIAMTPKLPGTSPSERSADRVQSGSSRPALEQTHQAEVTKRTGSNFTSFPVKRKQLSRTHKAAPATPPENPNKRIDRGRRSSVQQDENVFDNKAFHIDPTSFVNYKYHVDGMNVGKMFLECQVASTAVVNDLETKTTEENLYKFFSMNYIWDLGIQIRSMPDEIHKRIVRENTWPRSSLSTSVTSHCVSLDERLAQGLDIGDEIVLEKELRSITILYEVLAMELPVKYRPFNYDIEDTYCHGVIDALFTRQFPSTSVYKLDWANKEANGSKERRGYGLKPDAIISRQGIELAFVEVKPPKGQRCVKSYLEDLWKLANFCKDGIDKCLSDSLEVRKAAGFQIFGHQMTLFTMSYHHGIYHWAQSCSAYIPYDQQDSSRVTSCLRLLMTLQAFLDTIDLDPVPRTPPRIELDSEQVEQEDKGRQSKITPTKRD